MEVIQPYVVPPWEDRLPVSINSDKNRATEAANSTQGIQIATSSSGRRGMVGMGGVVHDTLSNTPNREAITYSITLGPKAEQHLYTAELMAISMAIRGLLLDLQGKQITIFTSN